MAQVVVAQQPQTQLKDPFVPTHLEPAAPAAPDGMIESWIHWIKELFAALAQLLTPETLEAQRVIPLPSLATTANYDTFKAFVYNDLDSRQDLVDRSITALDGNDVEARETEMHKLAAVLRMVADAGDWVKAHKAEFNSKGIEAVQINQTLLRSQQIVAKFLDKTPTSSAVLQHAPQGQVGREFVPPGLTNPGENNCFMNSTLQCVFGTPAASRWLAENDYQDPRIKLEAYKFRRACERGDTARALPLAQPIRNLFHDLRGRAQHDAHQAFLRLTEAFQGQVNPGDLDNFGKDRREYERGNPFVHLRERRATYDLQRDQIEESSLDFFPDGGMTHVTQEFEWCPILPLEAGQESQSFESLFEAYMCPQQERAHFDFEMKSGEKLRDVTCTEEINQYEKTPQELIFGLKRVVCDITRDSQSGKATFRYRKINDPVDIELSNYYDPKYAKDGMGGKIDTYAFVCHEGSVNPITGETGGHYIAYKKVNGEWYYCSDSTVRKAQEEEVVRSLKTKAILVFAKRSDEAVEDIAGKIRERVEASKLEQAKRDRTKLVSRLPAGQSESAVQAEVDRFARFHALLTGDLTVETNRTLLKDIFKILPTPFRDLAKAALITNVEAATDVNFEEHIAALKDIQVQYLTTEMNGNIVAQYQFIREKQLEMIRAEVNARKVTAPFLAQSLALRNSETHAKRLLANLDMVIRHYELNTDLGIVAQMQKTLLPGIDTLLGNEKNREKNPVDVLRAIRATVPDEDRTIEHYIALFETLAG